MSYILHTYRRAARHAKTPQSLDAAQDTALKRLIVRHGAAAVERHLPAILRILDDTAEEVRHGR